VLGFMTELIDAEEHQSMYVEIGKPPLSAGMSQ
jgi:hypothetical protein